MKWYVGQVFLYCSSLVRASQTHLLFKIVVGEEQDCTFAAQDTSCILKVLLNVLPAYNTLTRLGVMSGGDSDDFRRRRPKRLPLGLVHSGSGMWE
jgi:hypothetical protein